MEESLNAAANTISNAATTTPRKNSDAEPEERGDALLNGHTNGTNGEPPLKSNEGIAPTQPPSPTKAISPNTGSSGQKVSNGDSTAAAPKEGTTPLASRNPDSVSKEELLEILHKMNKKVKALSQLRAALTDRVKSAEGDKARLLEMMKKEILTEVDLVEAAQKAAVQNAESAHRMAEGDATGGNDGKEENFQNVKIDEISMLQLAWRAADERNQMALQQLQNEYKVISMQCQAEVEKVKSTAEAEKNAEIEQIRSQLGANGGLDSPHANTVDVQQEMIDAQTRLATEVMQVNHDEEMADMKAELEASHAEALQEAISQVTMEKETAMMEALHKALEEADRMQSEYDKQIQLAAEEIEEVKANKDEEITNLNEQLKIQAEQLSTEHKAELERASEETTKLSEQLEKLQQEHSTQLDAVRSQHSEEVEKVKSQSIDSQNSMLAEIQAKHEQSMKDAIEALNAEKDASMKEAMEKGRSEYDQQLKEALSKASESASAVSELQAQFEAKAQDAEAMHKAELEKASEETTKLSEQLEKLQQEHSTQLDAVRSQHSEEVEKVKSQSIDSQNSMLAEIQAKHEQSMKDAIEALNAEKDASMKEAMEKGRSEYDQQLKEALSKASESASAVSELQAQFEAKAQDAEAMHKAELEKASEETTKLSEQLEKLQQEHSTQFDTLQKQYTDKMSELEKSLLVNKSSEIQSLHDDFEERIQQIQQKFSRESNEAREETAKVLQETIVSKDEKINDLVGVCTKLEENIVTLKEEGNLLNESFVKEAESKLEALRSELEKKNQNDLISLREELALLQSKEIDSVKVDAEKTFQETLLQTKADFETEKAQILKMSSLGEDALRQELTLQNESMAKALKELETERTNFIENRTSDMDALRKELTASYASEIENLKVKAEADILSITTTNDCEVASLKAEYDIKIKDLESMLQNEGERVEDTQSRISALILELQCEKEAAVLLKKEVDTLNTQSVEKETDLKSELDNLLSSERASFKKTLKSLEDKHSEVEESLKQKYNDASDQISSKESSLAAAKEMIDEMRNEIKNSSEIVTQSQHEKVELKEILSVRESTISDLATKLKESTHEIQVIEKTKLEHAKELETLQEALKSSSEKHQQQIEDLSNLNEEWKAEKEKSFTELNDQLIEAKKQKEDFEAEVASLKANMSDDKKNALTELNDQLTEATKKKEELELEVESLKEKVEENGVKLNELERSHTISLEEVRAAAISSTEEGAVEKYRLLEEQVQSLQQESNNLVEKKGEFETQITTLENQKNKALELAKKVKEAASAKLKKANEEKSFLRKEYETRVASLEEAVRTGNEDLKRAIDDKCLADEQVAELSKKLDDVIQNVNASEKIQENFEKEKLEAIEGVKIELEKRLNAATTEKESAVKDLQKKMEKHANDVRAFYEGKVESVRNELELEKAALEKKLSSTLSSCNSITEDKTTLQNQLKSQMASEAALRGEFEKVKMKMEDSILSNQATASALLEEQESISKQNRDLKEKLTNMSHMRGAKDNKIDELNGKLKALEGNLNSISEQKRKLEHEYEEASKRVEKLDASESELGTARLELNRFKLEQTQSRALLQKLQAEKDSTEKKHGQRTALVGMLEAQLSEATDAKDEIEGKLEAAFYDIRQRDDEIAYLKEEVEKSQEAVTQAQTKTKTLMKTTTVQVTSSADKESLVKKTKLIESLQRELATLQQQMARKTSAAQRLLQERESDCKELKKRNKQMQQELDKGSLSDRRIFELAAQQSNRDSVANSEIEIRNKVVERLTDKLVSQDGDLASAELTRKQIEAKVEELSRIQRREDLNIDYLKSIIVQFLSKPSGSSEREALLPVIATLLQVIKYNYLAAFIVLIISHFSFHCSLKQNQFDREDYTTIELGKSKVSWLGSVLPTYINAPELTAEKKEVAPLLIPNTNGSSAEVKISSPKESIMGRPSALEF